MENFKIPYYPLKRRNRLSTADNSTYVPKSPKGKELPYNAACGEVIGVPPNTSGSRQETVAQKATSGTSDAELAARAQPYTAESEKSTSASAAALLDHGITCPNCRPPIMRMWKNFVPVPVPVNDTSAGIPIPTCMNTTERLQVEDALNYLDKVKYYFKSQPDRYNHFLDVMKEFKSHSISTSSVMSSVSNLFIGYPELIEGFNLFLPPGHKIEHRAGAEDQILVQDTQPAVTLSYTSRLHDLLTLSGRHADGTCLNDGVEIGIPQGSNQVSTQQASANDNIEDWNIPVITLDSEDPQYSDRDLIVDEDPQLQEDESPEEQASESFDTSDEMPLTNKINENLPTAKAYSPLIVNGFPVSHNINPDQFFNAVSLLTRMRYRFEATSQAEKYHKFLAILKNYEFKNRERNLGQGQPLSPKDMEQESREVYSQVSKLLENNEDFLRDFKLYLPDLTNHPNAGHYWAQDTLNSSHLSSGFKTTDMEGRTNLKLKKAKPRKNVVGCVPRAKNPTHKFQGLAGKRPGLGPKPQVTGVKRSGPMPQSTPVKRQKLKTTVLMKNKVQKILSDMRREPTLTPAGRFNKANKMIFFRKAQESFESKEIYNKFLHWFYLYMGEKLSKSELIRMISPLVSKHPDMRKWVEDFLGIKDILNNSVQVPFDQVVNPQKLHESGQDKVSRKQVVEIDTATCKKYGISYCVLHEIQSQEKCSGRTALCNEVLNDVLISCPNYSDDKLSMPQNNSNDTPFDTLDNIEDERFELDLVIEPNMSTIILFEAMVKEMNQMTPKQLLSFTLNDNLGGTSRTIHKKVISRLYGDTADTIIKGIKRNPSVAIPTVLRRLKAKADEWRDDQKNFNRDWRERYSV